MNFFLQAATLEAATETSVCTYIIAGGRPVFGELRWKLKAVGEHRQMKRKRKLQYRLRQQQSVSIHTLSDEEANLPKSAA